MRPITCAFEETYKQFLIFTKSLDFGRLLLTIFTGSLQGQEEGRRMAAQTQAPRNSEKIQDESARNIVHGNLISNFEVHGNTSFGGRI